MRKIIYRGKGVILLVAIIVMFTVSTELAYGAGFNYSGAFYTSNKDAAATFNKWFNTWSHSEKYYTSGYQGEYDCLRYARDILRALPGGKYTRKTLNVSLNRANFLKYCKGAKAGTHLRLSHKPIETDFKDGHSLVLMKVTDSEVYWTDENGQGDQLVRYRHASVDSFVNEYKDGVIHSKYITIFCLEIPQYEESKLATFTVQYNANGGTGSMANTSHTYSKASTVRKNTFTRSNFTFKGWLAYRKSNNAWLYSGNGKYEWCAKGKQPSGYVMTILKDQNSAAYLTYADKDVVTLYAVWTPKGTQTLADGRYHIVSHIDDNASLDVAGLSKEAGANVQLYASRHRAEQTWNVKYVGDGYYTITNVNSGKALDVYNASPENYANVQQWHVKDIDAQKWVIRKNSDGSYGVISKCNGLFMDAYDGKATNGTNVNMYKENNTAAQKWYFVEYGGQSLANGRYYIESAINRSRGVAVEGDSTESTSNVQIGDLVNEKQAWDVTHLGNGYYKIINCNSGKSLDVQEANRNSGVNVRQYNYNQNGANSQQWILKKNDDGSYRIIAKCGGKSLDAKGAVATPGTNIQTCYPSHSLSQKWYFVAYKEQPAQPAEPSEPTQPAEPSQPEEPDVPDTPDEPSHVHQWQDYYTVDKLPTCVEEGSKSVHCTICDEILDGSQITMPKTGHDWTGWSTIVEPTYEDAGLMQRVCDVCGKAETATLPKLERSYEEEDPEEYLIDEDDEDEIYLSKITLAKLKKGKKKVTVTWKKSKDAVTGYQIQYGLKKSFKSSKKATIKGAKKTKAVIKKLKAKKTYYFRIRAYKKVGGKVYYSSWSKAKSIKCK